MSLSIEEQLGNEGFYVSTTVGVSMQPMLRNRRDRIIVVPVGEERLKKWDLPLYRYPDGRYVLHRIIGVREDHYLIRGDNTYAVEKIPDEWVLGYVSEFYRGDKHILTSDKGYRRYAAFWNYIYFLRAPWHHIRTFLSRVKHRLFDKQPKGEEKQ